MLDKLERKIGKYAIQGLMNYLIAGYIIGYICSIITPNILSYMTLEPYMIIYNFQFWRLVTWLLIPPSTIGIFTIIMLFFYWQLGRSLEQIWGTFRFNVYIIGGVLVTVIGAIVTFLIMISLSSFNTSWQLWGLGIAQDPVSGIMYPSMGAYFSTYYINMSIFLAFALSIPDMQVLLYFIIPIKMKWLAILYAVLVGADFLGGNPVTKVAILCSLLNFLIFFFSTKRFKGFSGGQQRARRNQNWGGFSSNMNRGTTRQTSSGRTNNPPPSKNVPISRHKCAVCGRTEITNPGLEFRFCSKCNGNYEFCSDHLFSHEHIQ